MNFEKGGKSLRKLMQKNMKMRFGWHMLNHNMKMSMQRWLQHRDLELQLVI